MGHPGVPGNNQNYASNTHAQLKSQVDNNNDPAAAYQDGDAWHQLAHSLRQSAVDLDAAISGSSAHWEGTAADMARTHLAKVRDWSATSADNFDKTGQAVHDQADAAAKAKTDMPPPVDFKPQEMIEQAATNPVAMLMLPATMYIQHDKSVKAKEQAVQVIQTRDTSLQTASAAIPQFLPPPDLGGNSSGGTATVQGGTSSAPGGSFASYNHTGSAGAGSGGSHYAPGGPGSSYGGPGQHGGSGSYNQPGIPAYQGHSGPTQLSGYDPGVNPSGYNIGSQPPAGYNSPSTAPTSTSGPGGFAGGFGPGGFGGGADGEGVGGGRRAARGGTESSSAPGRSGTGPVAGAGGAGGLGAGGAGAAGAPGGAGTGRGGKKEEDKVHKRPSFLVETDDVFGDGQLVAPTVIGENPPGGF